METISDAELVNALEETLGKQTAEAIRAALGVSPRDE